MGNNNVIRKYSMEGGHGQHSEVLALAIQKNKSGKLKKRGSQKGAPFVPLMMSTLI
jgi:hypothetical protein